MTGAELVVLMHNLSALCYDEGVDLIRSMTGNNADSSATCLN
jgi:hypothetical protein